MTKAEPTYPQTYYVYTLAYPDGNIFYVGKGVNGRIADHEREAAKDCQCRKCNTIRGIWESGSPIQKRIVFETFNEQEAFDCEKALINAYVSPLLVNIKDNSYVEEPEVQEEPPVEVTPIPVPVVVAVQPVTPPMSEIKLQSEFADEIFSSEQAGRMLGIQPRAVISHAKRGTFPSFRTGDLWRFRRGDLEEFINRQKYHMSL